MLSEYAQQSDGRSGTGAVMPTLGFEGGSQGGQSYGLDEVRPSVCE